MSGHAKLLDFGLARVRDGVISLIPTAAGMVMGTPGAVDRALAFDKQARWQSAKEMFEALRAAYEQIRPGGSQPDARAQAPIANAELESPSLVVEIAFGSEHDQAVALERRRAQEAHEALSILSAADEG